MTREQATEHARFILRQFIKGYEFMNFTGAHPVRDTVNFCEAPHKKVNNAIVELAPVYGFEVVYLSEIGFLYLKKVSADE